jgi:tetratricopeptide (TPR) repeat protein
MLEMSGIQIGICQLLLGLISRMEISMFKLKKTISIIGLAITLPASAGLNDAWDMLRSTKGNPKYYPQVIGNFIEDEMYFTAMPYVKEYLASFKDIKSKRVDEQIDKIISEVGVRPFEILNEGILDNSKAPTIQYILAKKNFRKKKYKRALNYLNETIPAGHPTKPFALMLEASIFSILERQSSAVASYKRCVDVSESQMSVNKENPNRYRQLSLNRDYCIVGVARAQFAAGKFEEATLSFLDLPKESFIWPEILFEEAWNSFYQRDYNRALGKLVTYKAPLLNFVFNPEIDVLRAMTYMELCLWEDTKKVINDFYDKFQSKSLKVKQFMDGHGRDYKYYYLLAKSFKEGKLSGNSLLNSLLASIVKDSSYIEMMESFEKGKMEIEKIKSLSGNRAIGIFTRNIKDSLLMQRDLIGAYVRKTINTNLHQLDKNFEGMSYIKLEVLSREKSLVYNTEYNGFRSRGDIKHLKRNEKQYFWDFRGEFWADELGDYVFSLKSECK